MHESGIVWKASMILSWRFLSGLLYFEHSPGRAELCTEHTVTPWQVPLWFSDTGTCCRIWSCRNCSTSISLQFKASMAHLVPTSFTPAFLPSYACSTSCSGCLNNAFLAISSRFYQLPGIKSLLNRNKNSPRFCSLHYFWPPGPFCSRIHFLTLSSTFLLWLWVVLQSSI